ncbi:MAG TPA: amino acid adenylation domain-containing protein, partial [Pyrinomonadaceae bacterium]|nr:amino acid adenylation domain-containing protein [Pyrinomonadaceae bacterium]
MENIQAVISRVAEQHAARVAIARGDRLITYAELESESNRLANFLISSGARAGAIAAIVAADPARVVTAILGVLKAGGVFAPFDPLLPVKRSKSMAEQIAPSWLIVESEHFAKVIEIASDFEDDAKVVCIDGGEPKSGGDGPSTVIGGYAGYTLTSRPAVESKPDDMCSIFFTSGSTGKPKGIAGRLKGIAHFALWEAGVLGVGPGTRVSQLTSPSFDGFLKDVFVPLCVGGTVCVPESRDLALDARRLAEWIEVSGINVLHCVPSVFRSLLNIGLAAQNFPELRYVVMAGEPLLPADVGKWTNTFGERIRLVNLYGPTETTVTKLFHFVNASDKDRRSVPIGKPMPGSAAVVIDAEGRACPPGEVGEILIRTPYRALGYFNQPEMTAQVFVPNPLSNNANDIVYRTGDFGRVLEDGTFEFVGRKDHQVKIRGVRIELAEIENLLRGHATVGDVAVVDREDAMGNKYLCAYVVLNDAVEPGALREHLAKSLPDFMMPSAIIELESLPRTVNGKVDRKALPAPSADKTAFVAPRTAVEEVVAGIWAEVLGIERVGMDDNFFDLGGHSLLATQVMSRVGAALQAEVPLRRLFEGPTVGELSAAVEAALRDGVARAPRIDPAPRTGVLPLSFAQQRLWFLDQLESGSAFYNVPAAVRLNGALNVEVLKAALAEIIGRHEVLRTSFPTVDDQPVQSIAPTQELPFDVIDLGELHGRAQESAIASHTNAWSSLPFDLAHGPLLRVRLLSLSDTEHVLLFCMHHIVGDLWSMNVLVREWAMLYDALSQGKPSPLAELPVQYADYAVWQ